MDGDEEATTARFRMLEAAVGVVIVSVGTPGDHGAIPVEADTQFSRIANYFLATTARFQNEAARHHQNWLVSGIGCLRRPKSANVPPPPLMRPRATRRQGEE